MADNKNINIQKEEPDLYKRSIKGGFWIISSRVAINLLGFAKSLFIAHFFLLNDLGIISAAVMMMEILSTFTHAGFESALIQKKGDIHNHLDTAWTAGIIKGVLLFLALYFAAPLLTSFKVPEEKIPLAISAFRAMSLCFLVGGFRNIGAVYFSKNLEFHKTFALSVFTTLTDIVLSVGLILIFRSIWGIIAARIVTACVNCAGSYYLSSYRPRLCFIPAKAHELWKYGRWVFGSNILGYLLQAADDYFVWFYLGIQPLALYRYAFRFACTPATHIAYVISGVSFPAYSKIQDDLPRLREAYLKVLKITSLVAAPTAILIFVIGPDFVRVLLPERMHPMIFILQILAFKGLLKSIASPQGTVYRAIGKQHIIIYFLWFRIIILAATIYPFTRKWGIAGTALSTMLINVLADPISFWVTCKILSCSVWSMVREIICPLVASCIAGGAVGILKSFFFYKISLLQVCSLASLMVILYLCILWSLDCLFKNGIREIFYDHFRLIRLRR